MSVVMLLMTRSSDGFLCRDEADRMGWTGARDKALFRLLTLTAGATLAGSTTFRQLPDLPGRRVVRITRDVECAFYDELGRLCACSLARARSLFPGAVLIGGETVAVDAVRRGLIDAAVLTTVDTRLGRGVSDERLTRALDGGFDDVADLRTVPPTMVWTGRRS